MFLSPGQSGNVARHGQSYYTSGSVRGTARGGRGLAQNFRSPGWHRGIHLRYSLTSVFFFFVFCFSGLVCMYGLGMLLQHFSCIAFFMLKFNISLSSSGGAFISQTHFRESGPVFYHTRVRSFISRIYLCCDILQLRIFW